LSRPAAPARVNRVLVVLVALLTLVLLATLPRTLSYGELMDEHLRLKGHLQEVDRKMAEVDRILLRLRLYDAQLESLAEPHGDHGPLSEEDFANHRILEIANAEDGGVFDPETYPLEPGDLRPVEAWAFAVKARADTFLSLFEAAEPNLNELMRELEDLRALEEALPSSWPVDGTLTSGFGYRRHPLTRREWRFHSGLDISAKRNTPIHAAAPGKVVKAYFNSGYGKMVEIEHGFGITSAYAHCQALHVKEGDVVHEGQLIGTVGSTGRTTGPHLHFEVRLDGHPVDPMDYLPR
jgi:hypothetical protein